MSVWIAIEPDNELDGALGRGAAAAIPCDFGFPIGLLFIEAAEGLAPFRDGRPWFVGARHIGHTAPGGYGNLACVRGFTLGHPETAGLFGCGGEFRWHLSVDWNRRRKEVKYQCHTEDENRTSSAHSPDRSTVSSLAATDTTA